MKPNTASRTAWRVALRRAAHQLFDTPPVFPDPVALPIVGAEGRATIEAEHVAAAARPWDLFLRAFVAARSRFAEDELARAVAAGIRQYVVLGAGLDTFAYRNPHPGLRVFEVDYPATQAWKRDCLAAGGIAIPPSLTFAGVNFDTETLADRLQDTGFDAASPTFFSWLGVVPYLHAEAINGTLQWIAGLPPSTAVVFDYGLSRELLTERQRQAFDALAARVAAAGEPFRTLFDPRVLAADLTAMGFHHLEELPPDAINRRYFADRSDGLRVGSAGQLMHAVV